MKVTYKYLYELSNVEHDVNLLSKLLETRFLEHDIIL